MQSERLSILKTAETFIQLIWFPKVGDQVKLNRIKDHIVAVDQAGNVYLSKNPQIGYKAHELKYRPTPHDYLQLILKFQPVLNQLHELPATGRFHAVCKSGPFNFAVRGRPKQLLAKMLQARLHLVGVNTAVNSIVAEAHASGVKNVPRLQLVHSTT